MFDVKKHILYCNWIRRAVSFLTGNHFEIATKPHRQGQSYPNTPHHGGRDDRDQTYQNVFAVNILYHFMIFYVYISYANI